ncbi:hypothetical protein MIR68_009139 [Amoeboaphelidium protococcarum]|nr:hypothetical protein MIR68_009139 [Amoeboaphelidium protococcarum]
MMIRLAQNKIGTQKHLTIIRSASGNAQQKAQNASGSQLKQEVEVTIPKLPRESIYLPQNPVSLKQLDIDSIQDHASLNQVFALGTQSPLSGWRSDQSKSSSQWSMAANLFGMHPGIRNYIEASKSSGFLWRQCGARALERVINQAKNVILHGPSNSGKSVVLAQIMNALQLNASRPPILVHISNLQKIVDGSYAYQLNEDTLLWDQPEFQNQFNQYFVQLNQRSLQGLKLNTEWKSASKSFGPDTLVRDALLNSGKDSWMFTKQLLERLAVESDQKVVVLVDGVNALNQLTRYSDQNGLKLKGDQLTLLSSIHSIFSGDLKLQNGQLIGASTGFMLRKLDSDQVQTLGSDFEQIQVPYYDLTELQAMLKHLTRTNLLPADGAGSVDTRRIMFMTGGNPSQVLKYCIERPLFQS